MTSKAHTFSGFCFIYKFTLAIRNAVYIFMYVKHYNPMAVQKIKTLRDLNSYSSATNLVVIDAAALWCSPCRAIAPRIESLSEKYTTVTFLKFDVDESPDLAQEYGITAMPTFIFIKNGKVVATVRGADYSKVVQTIEANK
jgi:thioredoxin 1